MTPLYLVDRLVTARGSVHFAGGECQFFPREHDGQETVQLCISQNGLLQDLTAGSRSGFPLRSGTVIRQIFYTITLPMVHGSARKVPFKKYQHPFEKRCEIINDLLECCDGELWSQYKLSDLFPSVRGHGQTRCIQFVA